MAVGSNNIYNSDNGNGNGSKNNDLITSLIDRYWSLVRMTPIMVLGNNQSHELVYRDTHNITWK